MTNQEFNTSDDCLDQIKDVLEPLDTEKMYEEKLKRT